MQSKNGIRTFKWPAVAGVMCWVLVFCASEVSSQVHDDKNVHVDNNDECQISAIVKWCSLIVKTANFLDQLPNAET